LKRGVFVVHIDGISEDVWGIHLRVQVHKGATAANETVTEQEMDSLLCGDVSIGSHPCEQPLDSMLRRGVLRETRAKLGQSSVVRSRKNFGFARVFANVRDGRLSIKHWLHVDISPPPK
jgi:hypothetical protein